MNENRTAIPILRRIAKKFDINVVVLAESPFESDEGGNALSDSGRTFHATPTIVNKRIEIYTSDEIESSHPIVESNYFVAKPLKRAGKSDLLLGAYHGISRLEDELVDLDEEACNAAALLKSAEVACGHQRTLLMGDFNLNPFDHGLAKARGFYGVMSREDADRRWQRLKFNDYPLFYNPMWSRLGDCSMGPPGTFYREKTSHLPFYWHTYDQVLLRPELAERFSPDNLHVLDKIDAINLMPEGYPSKHVASDHLPLVIKLETD